MDFTTFTLNNKKIDEIVAPFEPKQETNKQGPLFNILERQAKELEEFGKRMSEELHTSYQEHIKQQQNEVKHQKLYPEVEPEVTCCDCREKTELINSLKARIQELENDSNIKNQNIKKLQKDVQTLFNIIVKNGSKKYIENPIVEQAKITITTTTTDDDVTDVEEEKEIEKNRLSVENIQYNENIKDSFSDSAIDLFTDDDDDASTGYSVKSEDSDYVYTPSEWLDVPPTMAQRAKIDKRNLDRWNSKMASNGLLPIRLVGKVDAEREKKYQTHRKRYSTSAIWLKTYESKQKQKQKQNKNEKFRIPSFAFSFGTSEDVKKKEDKEISDPISLKSSVSTSVSELTTTSLATTSLQSYEAPSKENHKTFNSKSQQILSQYK